MNCIPYQYFWCPNPHASLLPVASQVMPLRPELIPETPRLVASHPWGAGSPRLRMAWAGDGTARGSATWRPRGIHHGYPVTLQ